jgi:RNA polymerase sigma-70 factor, ECF subfamily
MKELIMEDTDVKIVLSDNPHYAVEFLAEQYGYEIYKLAFFYLKDKGLAEDVTQEVFVKCLEKVDQFNGNSEQAKYWLLKITTNKCKDILKSLRYKFTLLSSNNLESLQSREPSQENKFIQKYEEAELVSKILKLPIKYREVIILFYYQELTIKEISTILAMSENTVKSRLHRGKEKLKASLKGVF